MSKGREIVLTKAISKEECEKVERFNLMDMGDASASIRKRSDEENEGSEPAKPMLTAEQIEEIQQQAYQEAYEQGLAEGKQAGIEAGKQEMQSQAQQLQSLIQSLQTPFENLDDQVVDEMVSMVITMAKHLIRRELKMDPGQIVAVAREAVGALPIANREIHIYLHPEDAKLIREALSLNDEQSRWQLHEDPTISRGGLKVATENSQIDATVETRLSKIIAQAFGDERGSESDES